MFVIHSYECEWVDRWMGLWVRTVFYLYVQVLIFKTIINFGCNPHFQPGVVNDDGYTPLGLAVKNKRLKIVKYLITEQNIDLKGMYM